MPQLNAQQKAAKKALRAEKDANKNARKHQMAEHASWSAAQEQQVVHPQKASAGHSVGTTSTEESSSTDSVDQESETLAVAIIDTSIATAAIIDIPALPASGGMKKSCANFNLMSLTPVVNQMPPVRQADFVLSQKSYYGTVHVDKMHSGKWHVQQTYLRK